MQAERSQILNELLLIKCFDKYTNIKSIETGPYRSYAILQHSVLTWGKTFFIENNTTQQFEKSRRQKEKSIIQDLELISIKKSQFKQRKNRLKLDFLNQSSINQHQNSQYQMQTQQNQQNQTLNNLNNFLDNHLKIIPIKVNHIAAGLQHTFAYYNIQQQQNQKLNNQKKEECSESNLKQGKVYCWGSNLNYELGIQGQSYFGLQNVQLFDQAFQAGFSLRQISCGQKHTIAVLQYVPSNQTQQQLTSEKQTKQVKMSVWGQSKSYQLTLDTTSIVPYPVMSQCNIGNIKHIYSKSDFNIVLLQNGQAYSWGSNMFNRLGLQNKNPKIDYEETIKKRSARLSNHNMSQNSPSQSLQKVRIPKQIQVYQKISKIGIGVYHAIAVTQSGKGYSWGSGLQGQLGVNKFCCEAEPTLISFSLNLTQKTTNIQIKDVSCGQHHSLILDNQNRIFSCGSNAHGCLGHQKYEKSHNQKKKRCKIFELIDLQKTVEKDEKIIKISCGYRHNLCLTNKNQLLGWGSNHYHQVIPMIKQENNKDKAKNQNQIFQQNQKNGKNMKRQNQNQKNNFDINQTQSQRLFQKQCWQWKQRFQKFQKQKQAEQSKFMKELTEIYEKYKINVYNPKLNN